VLDLSQVQSFLAIVDTGSFHDAARRLDLAQPTVSQHLRKLETALGTALIVRNHIRCTTTRKGAEFLPHARRLLRAEAEARGSLELSRLVVGAASNLGIYLLPPVVQRFRRRFGAEPRIELSIASNPVIAEQLLRGDVDLAVTEWWGGEPGFEAVAFRSEPLVVIVPPDHPAAGRGSIGFEELVGEPLIGGEPGTGTGRLLREAFGPKLASQLSVVSELGSTEAVKRAVAAGLGVSIVLEAAVAEEVRAGSLCALAIEGTELRKPLFVTLPENTPSEAWPATFRSLLVS
jgi:DNA-binding transcriptional LysR family regulator